MQWLDRILEATPPVNGRLDHGGGGERSELVCGGFAVDQLTTKPLLEALPSVVHLRGSEGRSPDWLVGLIRMIATEMASSGPGSEAVVTRLTDALLAQAVRQSLQDSHRGLGKASAVSDPHIARALRLIRDRPEHPWTVPAMAAAVSMSRYRMARVEEYLRSTQAGIREIARLTGYDSEVSVTKAFRRHFGIVPGAYRKANGGGKRPN